MLRPLMVALALTAAVHAAPVRILAIGDSLTDEYGAASRFVFSATAANPDQAVASNWPELLETFRPDQAEFGSFADRGDLRSSGYQWNFGIVGTTTTHWGNLVTTESIGETPDDDFPLNFLYSTTRQSLINQLPLVDVVVIFLGGNDLKNRYSPLFNDTEPGDFFPSIRSRLNLLHLFVRQQRPNVPIIVATLPDVGATPQIHSIYNVPTQQTSTRAKIAAFNDELAAFFGAKANTSVARVDSLTDQVLDIVLGVEPGPFEVNGHPLAIPGDSQISQDRLFCRDNFHPNTVAHALITNQIIAAINGFFPDSITPFANREILGPLLGLDPDQPYLDWIAAVSTTRDGPGEDPDGDGLPNLVEMILGTRPDAVSQPLTGSSPAGISWTPVDTRYATLDAEESSDLERWTPVPAERLSWAGSTITATPPATAGARFLRLRATPRP